MSYTLWTNAIVYSYALAEAPLFTAEQIELVIASDTRRHACWLVGTQER